MDYRENGVKFAMTTKGIWYVTEIAVSNDNVIEALEIANKAMARANRILCIRNRYRVPKEVKDVDGKDV